MELRFEALLSVPPERAFAAVTEARYLANWFCDSADSDPRPGGALTLRWNRQREIAHPFVATWGTFERPSHAAFRGGHAGYPHGDAGDIAFTITPLETGSRLAVCHALPDDPEYAAVARTFVEAWPRALRRLTAYLTPHA